jgi:membrane dipeptidase
MTDRAEEQLAAGARAIDVWVETRELLFQEIATDSEVQRQYLSAWDQVGVTCISATQGVLGRSLFSFETAVDAIAQTTRLLDALPTDLMKVTRAEDVRQAKREGKHGIIFNLQNTSHFEADWRKLEVLRDLGVRVLQLTYNSRNLVGDGCTERTDAGLSDFGTAVVRRLNEMGILIDLSHCGTQTAWDAIRASRQPVIFSHTFSRSLSSHARGKTDDLLRGVADTGGYIGILVVPTFISDRSDVTLEAAVDHIEHAVEVCGIDRVGIGTDCAGGYPKILADALNKEMNEIGWRAEHRVNWNINMADYRSWLDWPNITRRLVQRGFSDVAVQKILGLNFLGVFESVVG